MAASVIERFRELVVDESDPFYFDHPLDHVPGMLLFSGMLDLAVRADAARSRGRRAGRVVAGLDFTRFCELDRGTTLSCRPVPGRNRAWTVAARQAAREVCAGSIAFAEGAAPANGDDSAGAPPDAARRPAVIPPSRQAPALLVHRHRPENILVGEPVRHGRGTVEAAVLRRPGEEPDGWRPVQIVEAGRQFATMLEHSHHGRPMDARLLWVSLRMDVPFRLDRSVPLMLRWPVARVAGPRSRCAVTLADASTGAGLGSLTYEAYAVDPERYERTRSS
ncbi:AfsA-related hotdog domain-containing protein [Actinomadura sp. NTSP31]|uniref:AfsA-related hotdog domain-containing protein n=1 Tax=Actinomadura sp. NTSP31 TaxID=1735447 RepID=UPI0035C20EF6